MSSWVIGPAAVCFCLASCRSRRIRWTIVAARRGVASAWRRSDQVASYWRAIADPTDAVTLEQAIGVNRGVGLHTHTAGPSIMQARLLDTGHTHATFLTDEFGFALARRRRTLLRALFWIAGIALPLHLDSFWIARCGGRPDRGRRLHCRHSRESGWGGGGGGGWLFLGARRSHTVRLYHGDART